MNARAAIGAVIIVSVGAFGYAAGRLTIPRGPKAATANSVPVPASLPAPGGPPMPALDELGDLSTVAFDSVLHAVARATPESLRAFVGRLQNIKEPLARRTALEVFFRTLMQTNPPLAKAMTLELEKRRRLTALCAARNAAPAQAMPYVVDIIWNGDVGQTSGCSFDYLTDALRDWSQTDPRAARDYLEAHPDIKKQLYSPIVLEAWAASEPNEARVWMDEQVGKIRTGEQVSSFDTESRVNEFEEAWVKGLFRYDHKAAIDYVLAGSDDPHFDCAPDLLNDLYVESPEQARAFIEQLPVNRRATALRQIEWIAGRGSGAAGSREDQITSPAFLISWVLQLPPQVRGDAVVLIVNEWSRNNKDGLFAWMQTVSPEIQQEAIAGYNPYLPKDFVENELSAVMKVPDGPLRAQLLERVVRGSRDNRDIMLACLEKAPLSQEQKQYLASLIPEQQSIDRSSEDD